MLKANPSLPIRRIRRLSAFVALATVLGGGFQPALAQSIAKETVPPLSGQPQPLEFVRSSISRVLAATDSGQRRLEIRRAAAELFDFDEMARLMLTQYWKDGSPGEQEEFIRLFADLLERAYLMRLGNVPLTTMTFVGESINGPYARVRSRIAIGRLGETSVEYRLLASGGRWGVYDIVLDGVSLVSSYRSQFSSILRTSSFAQLLDRLRYRGTQAGSPDEQGQ
jgi:phospholipid transport system substrate-binding protein